MATPLGRIQMTIPQIANDSAPVFLVSEYEKLGSKGWFILLG